MTEHTLDQLDLKLLEYLQANGRISVQELAKLTGASRVTVHDRLRRLTVERVITGYHAHLDPRAVGFPVVAFIGLTTGQGRDSRKTLADLGSIPEIEEVHVVTGRFDVIIKIRAQSTEHLQRVLFDKVQQTYAFGRSETMVVLSSPVETLGPDLSRLDLAASADRPRGRVQLSEEQ